MQVFGRWLPLVASCFTATGCSMASLGYEFFPTWAQWQVDSYLSLDAEQKNIVYRRLGELHGWHRQAQLPAYVDFIKTTKQRPLASSTPEEAGKIRQQVMGVWQPVADQLSPGLAELLLTLKPQQLDRLNDQFAKANAKLREEYLPTPRSGWFGGRVAVAAEPAPGTAESAAVAARPSAQLQARREARVARFQKRIEYFLGDLNPEQQRVLRDLAAEMPATEEVMLAEREARQQRFLALARRVQKEAPPQAEVERWCREFLATLWLSPDNSRRARIDGAAKASDQLTARMMATATPEQQAHFVDRMHRWERDFARMAGLD